MFYNDILFPYSPIITQGHTCSCWAFSMASYWDTEFYILHHRWLYISPWFMVYHKILQQQRQCMSLKDGQPHKIPTGGLGQTAIQLAREYGYLNQSEYCWPPLPGNRYRNMMRIINGLTLMGHYLPFFRPLITTGTYTMLNYVTKKPVLGHTAEDLDLDLIQLTNFCYLPQYQEVTLDLPDNIDHTAFHNIPLTLLMNVLDYTLEHGHSLVWEGGIRGGQVRYSKKKGVTVVSNAICVTEQLRSDYYQQHLTQDDHMLHIVGRAHDEAGNIFYIAKDSSQELGPYKGLIYLSREYVMLKTICIILNKEVYEAAVSEHIANRN